MLSAPSILGTAARSPWALRALFALALVFALREAQVVLAPIVIAVVLTFVLAPAVRMLRRWHVPEVAGAGLVVLALLASTVPLAASLAEPAAQWAQRAPTTLAELLAKFDRFRAALPGLGPPPAPAPAAAPPAPTVRGTARNAAAAAVAAAAATPPAAPPPDPVKERLASEGVALTGALLQRGVTVTMAAAAIVILLYFFLASEHWMLSRTVEAIPRRRSRALLLGGVRAAQREIGRYLFALGCINFAAGALTGVAVWWLGLPNPTLWGAIVAVLCFIPYIGPLIITGLLLLAGMASFDEWSAMLAPAAAFLLIHAVESNVVSPWIVGRRLALSPISVFLSVMFWGWLWGIPGALIAVPVLIAIRSVCLRTRRLRLLARFLEGDRRAPPSLRSLLRPRQRPGFGSVPLAPGLAAVLRGGMPAVPVPPVPQPVVRPGRIVTSKTPDVAQAGGVHVLPAAAGEHEFVTRPFQHHP